MTIFHETYHANSKSLILQHISNLQTVQVQDEYSVATVYVHGFGTSDYEDPYAHNDLYVPPHKVLPKVKVPPPPPAPKVPVYRPPEPEPEVIK